MRQTSGQIVSWSTLICVLAASPVWAQVDVTADGSTGTIVTYGAGTYTITGGQLQQGNTTLLHSFDDFSLNSNTETIHFDLGHASYNGVTTVIGRVTGRNPSTINGQIRLTPNSSTPDLFLINPNGLVFGAGASLNVPGSFVASTAENVLFANGVKFGLGNTPSALLTISAPMGLQVGQTPAAIAVQGTLGGSSLQVGAGRTLALMGGDVTINNRTLSAPQGQIELGSLTSAGEVSLTPSGQGYALTYASGQNFGEIRLTQAAGLDVSGVNAGAVQIQARRIQMTEGSLIWARNFGPLVGGNIVLQASESIDLIGNNASDPTDSGSGVRSISFGGGAGGNILINTPRLSLQAGAKVQASTFGISNSGNITINAPIVELYGFSPLPPIATAIINTINTINTSTFTAGSAGRVAVNSQDLLLMDGGNISSATFGSGSSGQVTVQTTTATIRGSNPSGLPSNITSSSIGSGSASTLMLNTTRLSILGGGSVSATSALIGKGGDVTVTATEAIEVRGRNSSINASAVRPPQAVQQAFGLPNILTANSGNINITTPYLVLADGGTVSVTNQGTGNSGQIEIAAHTLYADRQGSIQGQTTSGEGGNIILQLQSGLIMRHGSFVNTTAGGTGNGGNITVNAPVIAGFENSDIIANAFQGNGGNIQITTQGIFGLAFRRQLTPDNDITASSRFGVSGTVTINTPGINPGSSLVELPANLSDANQQIAKGCSASQDNSFTATGRGGLPMNPSDGISSDHTWNDTRDLSAFMDQPAATVPAASTHPAKTIVEISSWRVNAQGQVELIANPSDLMAATPYATCAG